MNIFIDCEFNGYRGELISMALVDETGRQFYEVLKCENPQPWVAENVMPILNKEPVSRYVFEQRLRDFLYHYEASDTQIRIVADWPADIVHFCQQIEYDGGYRFGPTLMVFVVDSDLSSGESKIPHNALEDAIAIQQAWLDRAYS